VGKYKHVFLKEVRAAGCEFPSKKRGAGVCIKRALEDIKGNIEKIGNKHTP